MEPENGHIPSRPSLLYQVVNAGVKPASPCPQKNEPAHLPRVSRFVPLPLLCHFLQLDSTATPSAPMVKISYQAESQKSRPYVGLDNPDHHPNQETSDQKSGPSQDCTFDRISHHRNPHGRIGIGVLAGLGMYGISSLI